MPAAPQSILRRVAWSVAFCAAILGLVHTGELLAEGGVEAHPRAELALKQLSVFREHSDHAESTWSVHGAETERTCVVASDGLDFAQPIALSGLDVSRIIARYLTHGEGLSAALADAGVTLDESAMRLSLLDAGGEPVIVIGAATDPHSARRAELWLHRERFQPLELRIRLDDGRLLSIRSSDFDGYTERRVQVLIDGLPTLTLTRT